MMKTILSLLALQLLAVAAYAGHFPFPAHAAKQHGIITSVPDSAALESLFRIWKQNFYEESGSLGRIKFDIDSLTVSEGIGYGMLIFVQMDNAVNKTQTDFNKLWKYYNTFLDADGLMHWKIDRFTGPTADGTGAATDAELDAALALVLAHYQWGSRGAVNYIGEAEMMIDKIYRLEVADHTHLLKPGDGWDRVKNPSYCSLAALKMFAEVQVRESFTRMHDWMPVISASYAYLHASQHPVTGLYPEWNTPKGKEQTGYSYNFEYNACRTPWRAAWDFAWWGSPEARSLSAVTAAWTAPTPPDSLGDKYSLSGTCFNRYNNSCFIGGLGCSFLCDAAYQDRLDAYYDTMKNRSGDDHAYFASSLRLLYLLLMSGNTVNPIPCDR